ncbi:sigma-70 family RNA polymerase sigma factor [Aeromicrobium panaciterrae]|uniref:sigma-70 family RNA polymerase sigma factor n=1 Tax=Aeromicrobium panaciterrae TaxID=363861 RepID=UPI00286ACCD0|nr:sigma-70 family RNA polymerase sigma factor [Aeromicrobium panaciterrae]
MDAFIKSLLAQPQLAAADEQSLARRARDGDPEARDTLITAGMRAVALRAMLHGFRGDEMRDAVQSGALGLIRAVDRFDPDCGTRLSTYAWHWIGSAMKQARRDDPLNAADEPFVEDAIGDGHELLLGLPDELAEVLRLRYGLGAADAAPMTLSEVAHTCSLTVAQVRQREAKAMRHLRVGLAKVVHRAPHRGADPL